MKPWFMRRSGLGWRGFYVDLEAIDLKGKVFVWGAVLFCVAAYFLAPRLWGESLQIGEVQWSTSITVVVAVFVATLAFAWVMSVPENEIDEDGNDARNI